MNEATCVAADFDPQRPYRPRVPPVLTNDDSDRQAVRDVIFIAPRLDFTTAKCSLTMLDLIEVVFSPARKGYSEEGVG